MQEDSPLRILSVLGQKPGMTGSGVLLKELWKCASDRGDKQLSVVAGYPSDDYSDMFGDDHRTVVYSSESEAGNLPFPILGMSDGMPYRSLRYRDASAQQIEMHVAEYIQTVREAHREFAPDVIHIHHLWVLVALAAEFEQTPTFVTVHGTGLKQLGRCRQYRDYVLNGLPYVTRLFGVSRDICDDVVTEYSIPADRESFIGNGFDEKTFHTIGNRAEADRPVVLTVGKFVDWKGFRFLIRACRKLSRSHQLVILGTGPAEEKSALVGLTHELCMDGCTRFLGHLDHEEVARWMRRADVFVLPSIKEPFGLALLEAMACGCPAIAANVGGPKDLLNEDLCSGGLATLIPPLIEGDEPQYVQNLANAIEEHLSDPASQDDREKIASSVEHMTWRNVYRSIRSEYKRAH